MVSDEFQKIKLICYFRVRRIFSSSQYQILFIYLKLERLRCKHLSAINVN